MNPIYRDRVEASIEIWGNILKRNLVKRGVVVDLLRKTYEKRGVEPIRGKTKIDIYDKEMATLYLVGKYGLGLDEKEAPEIFGKVFRNEILYEKAFYEVLNGLPSAEVIKKYFGKVDENVIFRVLRLGLTKTLLGWEEEGNLIKVIKSFIESFPQYVNRLNSFIRFYIALRLAERIVNHEIRNRLEKEAYKHSMCVKFGSLKNAPPDSLVREIAVYVFKGKEFEVNSVLNLEKGIELKG